MKRTVIIVLSVLLVLAGVGIGAQQWLTRPRGTPQAVEFSEAALGESITSARVIGLGEATHGNAEFQQLRLELVHKLDDAAVILLEEDFGRVAGIDAWVNGGAGGDAEEMARSFGFVLNHTQQMADFLQGLRDLNEDRPVEDRIHLVGTDVQRVAASKEIALSWLASHDPVTAQTLGEQLAGWDDNTDPDLAAITPVVDDLVRAIATSAEDGGRQLAHDATIALQQNLALEATSSRSTTRAEIMADNVIRSVDRLADDRQALVFSHNGHLDKSAAAYGGSDLGTALADHFGDDYRVIGTEFVHNTLTTGNRDDRWSVTWTHRTPLRGIFSGTAQGYLEFAGASPQNKDILQDRVRMGSAGESFQQWQAWIPFLNSVSMVPVDSYDALVLVEQATAVTPLR